MLKIFCGTSGYSFADWKGNFYPQDIKQADMLPFYTKHFNAVEINSSYYAIPKQATFERMGEVTPDNFEFVVKAYKDITHEYKDVDNSITQFLKSIEPLQKRNKFGGIIAQFPWKFKNTKENRDYLISIRKKIPSFPLFIEFRNDSWMTPEIGTLLKENNLGYCSVDEPKLKGLIPPYLMVTTDTPYIRLHGRNEKKWWSSGEKSSGDRYDYLYTSAELDEWVEKIKKLIYEKKDDTLKKIYIFFNNCHNGQAVQNAKEMQLKLYKFCT